MTERGPYDCWDCRKVSPSYMVHNDVWLAAMPDYRTVKRELLARFKHEHPERCHVLLCFECLERRLGRRLTLADFTPAPINQPIHKGYEIATAGPQGQGSTV